MRRKGCSAQGAKARRQAATWVVGDPSETPKEGILIISYIKKKKKKIQERDEGEGLDIGTAKDVTWAIQPDPCGLNWSRTNKTELSTIPVHPRKQLPRHLDCMETKRERYDLVVVARSGTSVGKMSCGGCRRFLCSMPNGVCRATAILQKRVRESPIE